MTTSLTFPIPASAEAAQTASAWPFEEARKLVERLERSGKSGGAVRDRLRPLRACRISAPSARWPAPRMVRHAFRVLTGDRIPTRLVAFSDDMDGLRKVPDNVPNKELLATAPRQAADRGARPVRHA